MSFDLWQTADPDAGGDTDDLNPPPDGFSDVALMDASAFTSKKGDAIVKLVFKELGGTEHQWTVLQMFKSQGQANMTKRQVRALGVDIEAVLALEQLDTAVREKIGNYYRVEITTSPDGKFRNTYIQEDAGPVQSDIPGVPVTAPAAPEYSDDVPF